MTTTLTSTPRPAPAEPDRPDAGRSRGDAGTGALRCRAPEALTPVTTPVTTVIDGTVGGGLDEAGLTSALRLAVGRLYRSLRLHGQDTTDTVPVGLLSALDTLRRRGELTPGELAAAEQIRPPSTTRMINTLVRAGWISRRQHPADRRQAVRHITAAGIELLTAETIARERWLDQRLATLTTQERQTLTRAAHLITTVAQGPDTCIRDDHPRGNPR